MGTAVTAAAKQHKLAKAAVYLPDSSTPLGVSLLLRQTMSTLHQHKLFVPAGACLPAALLLHSYVML